MFMMKTVIIVQARMSSTRLPGKVLKKVLGKTLLEYQIERLRAVQLADDIVIATTINHAEQRWHAEGVDNVLTLRALSQSDRLPGAIEKLRRDH